MRGCFITLEGGEGTGKSTQLKNLTKALQKNGIICHATQQPGGTPLGKSIRPVLLSVDMAPEVELMLFLADRLHHINTVIEPALKNGEWVICDRFIDSSVVYQALALGKDADWIYTWHKIAGITLMPDITFLFQEPVSIALQRRYSQPHNCNKFDQSPLDFHCKVDEAYKLLAEQFPKRYVQLPVNQSVESLTNIIMDHITQRFL